MDSESASELGTATEVLVSQNHRHFKIGHARCILHMVSHALESGGSPASPACAVSVLADGDRTGTRL